jgi:hypothetical protein
MQFQGIFVCIIGKSRRSLKEKYEVTKVLHKVSHKVFCNFLFTHPQPPPCEQGGGLFLQAKNEVPDLPSLLVGRGRGG